MSMRRAVSRLLFFLFSFFPPFALAMSGNGSDELNTVVENNEAPTDNVPKRSDLQIANYLKTILMSRLRTTTSWFSLRPDKKNSMISSRLFGRRADLFILSTLISATIPYHVHFLSF